MSYANWKITANNRDCVHRPVLRHIGQPPGTHSLAKSLTRLYLDNPIRWGIADQAWAIEHGIFVCRMPHLGERAGIKLLDARKFKPDWDPDRDIIRNPLTDKHDAGGYRVMQEIERRGGFRREQMWERLYDFIIQQDRWGCTGAWHNKVAMWTHSLLWYKLHCAATYQARSNAKRARAHNRLLVDQGYAARARRAMSGE